MINIQEAFNIIDQTVKANKTVSLTLNEGLGKVLSKDVLSKIDMPPFNQSAMDGYAINANDKITNESRFKLVGEIKAGDDASNTVLKENESIRIFTGAMIPSGTTHVAQQEIVNKEDGTITITKSLNDYANIRLKGEQTKVNDIACKKGTKLTAGIIGYLATLGIASIEVYQSPRIAILTTGDELQTPGKKLSPGKIYESNGIMLSSLLSEMRISASVNKVKDDFEATKNTIESLINSNDIIIITGGISVGDYDFVGKALKTLKCQEYFYKVKQKPGKPMYYGRLDETYIFALPGNPGAVMSCFYMYVKPALNLLMGMHGNEVRTSYKAKLEHDYLKKGDRPVFLKAHVNNQNKVTLLTHQSSAMLNSFVHANCLAFIEGSINSMEKNEAILIYPI